MATKLIAVFQDGRSEPIAEYDDLLDAVSECLRLVDAQGRIVDALTERPAQLQIITNEKMDLAIRVRTGGLAGPNT